MNTRLEDIIIKYLTDKISKEELNSLQEWLKLDDNNERFEEFVKANQELDNAYSYINKDAAYKRIREAIDKKGIIKIKPYKKAFQYAAAIMIFVFVSFGVYSTFFNDQLGLTNEITLKLIDGSFREIDVNSNKNVTNTKGEVIAHVENKVLFLFPSDGLTSTNNFNELNVPYGRRIKVKLSDSTHIVLNSGSQLKIPESFSNQKSRDVFLEGEAYFDVAKDKNTPFIVHTQEMNVRVLGTRFNISNYANDNTSFVALEEGSVAVNKPFHNYEEGESIIIKPGEQVLVRDSLFDVKETNIEKDIAWIKGQLYFKNDRFEDIIKKLKRYYNIKIENNSEHLNDIRYTGVFTDETIDEVLTTFKEVSDFKYQIEDDKILISNQSN